LIALPPRWLITDLDCTLLNSASQLSDYAVGVLRRAQSAGLGVLLASGRMIPSMWPHVRRIGSPLPFVACNGAQIAQAGTQQVIYTDYVPTDAAREAALALEEAGCYFHFYSGGAYYFAQPTPESDAYRQTSGVQGYPIGGPLSRRIDAPVIKMLAVAQPPVVARLLPLLRQRFAGRLYITDSAVPHARYIEITHVTATKGNALLWLCDHLGADPADVVAFGDGGNDVTMLRAAGTSVAVANASPEAKTAAAHVCETNDRDGVVRYIEKNLL
jgi:Cof subfamily protein (haloacid dehalogenase superfamily)